MQVQLAEGARSSLSQLYWLLQFLDAWLLLPTMLLSQFLQHLLYSTALVCASKHSQGVAHLACFISVGRIATNLENTSMVRNAGC